MAYSILIKDNYNKADKYNTLFINSQRYITDENINQRSHKIYKGSSNPITIYTKYASGIQAKITTLKLRKFGLQASELKTFTYVSYMGGSYMSYGGSYMSYGGSYMSYLR